LSFLGPTDHPRTLTRRRPSHFDASAVSVKTSGALSANRASPARDRAGERRLMLWFALAGLTVLAALAAIWPILRSRDAAEGDGEASAVAFHKAQLAEIARDVERGQLPPDEAAAARAEAARRLIAASAEASPSASTPSRRTRMAAAALVIVGFPAIAFSLYLKLGAPDLPDEPLARRESQAARAGGVEAAVAGVEAHLIAAPDDGKGWAVLAPVYMRLGRYSDAVRAYGEDLRINGEDALRRSAFGEALVAEAGGIVTAKAREAFDKALSDKPGQPQARFYLALALEQEGKTAEAITSYQALIDDSPKDAPWVAAVQARLAALKGEPAPQAPADSEAAAAAPPAEQQAMIRGMVQRLADRLAADGGDVTQWSRLIRAYAVLQEVDKANSAYDQARKALAADAAATASLDGLARELGLGKLGPGKPGSGDPQK
jgi:cytochrome c-type biogenesis protein CcmH